MEEVTIGLQDTHLRAEDVKEEEEINPRTDIMLGLQIWTERGDRGDLGLVTAN